MRTRLALAAALAHVIIGVSPVPPRRAAASSARTARSSSNERRTLAAYHDGVEHYVTSFEFTGEGKEVGSIIPLPGVPTAVERGGSWTLQRLEREVAPPVPSDSQPAAAEPRPARRRDRALPDPDRRARDHDPPGGRHRGRQMGHRSRLPA